MEIQTREDWNRTLYKEETPRGGKGRRGGGGGGRGGEKSTEGLEDLLGSELGAREGFQGDQT